MSTFDLTSVTFEEFVTFLFDHEADDSSPEPPIELPADLDDAEITIEISIGTVSELGDTTVRRESDPWYFSLEVQFDPRRLVGHYTRLFKAPEFLIERFSPAQLDQGFWAIHGGALDCSVQQIIWEPSVAFDERAECVRAMASLFDRLAALDARNPAPSPWWESSLNMWWDSLAYDWHCGNRVRIRGGEDLLMQDVIFETLRTILDLDHNECRWAALHGLGHLHHPDTEVLVRQWLERVSEGIDDELRSYAISAAAFEVL